MSSVKNKITHQESTIKTYQKCLIGLLALLPLFSLGLMTSEASAQQYGSNPGALKIDGFNVDEVPRLTAGTDLNFTLYGTPGATATLRIDGAQRNLNLHEDEAGQYEGVYTISLRDNITARSSVTGNLRVGNQVVSMVLSESLQAGVGYRAPDQASGAFPKIARFDVLPSSELSGGNDLTFTLYGTPGGKAEIGINGAKGKFFLPEVRSGEYSGIYTIKSRDRIASNSAVTANLRVGDRMTSATLGKALLTAAAPAPRIASICTNCGSVEAVNIIEIKGDGNYLGAIGGGLVGGLLGNQVGGGNGKTAATIAGALGGALAGRAIEGNTRKTVQYEVLVRMQNGGTQTVSYKTDPGYRVGDKVRITDGVLARNVQG
jgi:outer membrane lipoprotein SlyB